jgi:hypothetical protein
MFDFTSRSNEGWMPLNVGFDHSFSHSSTLVEPVPFYPQPEPVTIYNVVAITTEDPTNSNNVSVTIVASFSDKNKADKLSELISSFAASNVTLEVHCSLLEM